MFDCGQPNNRLEKDVRTCSLRSRVRASQPGRLGLNDFEETTTKQTPDIDTFRRPAL